MKPAIGLLDGTMATVHAMIHSTSLGQTRPLGLVVWVPEAARYFGIEDEDASNRRMAEAVVRCDDLAWLVGDLLDRGLGPNQTLSHPEEIEATSLLDAARQISRREDLLLDIPRKKVPRCSRCNGFDDLRLITANYIQGEPDGPGRILAYCGACRAERPCRFIDRGALAEFTVDSFVGLYRDGATTSDEKIAAEIVFGEAPLEAVRGAKEEMGRRRGGSDS